MNNNDLYKEKYLKYKFKYLELSKLLGGKPYMPDNRHMLEIEKDEYRGISKYITEGDIYIQNVGLLLNSYMLIQITEITEKDKDIKVRYIDYKNYYNKNNEKDRIIYLSDEISIGKYPGNKSTLKKLIHITNKNLHLIRQYFKF